MTLVVRFRHKGSGAVVAANSPFLVVREFHPPLKFAEVADKHAADFQATKNSMGGWLSYSPIQRRRRRRKELMRVFYTREAGAPPRTAVVGSCEVVVELGEGVGVIYAARRVCDVVGAVGVCVMCRARKCGLWWCI